jgi:5-methyltetrahydrofolate--homocysteine methyltransferase
MGQYDVSPEQFAQSVKPMLDEGLVDIIGGCCGTTPEHIKAVVDICR